MARLALVTPEAGFERAVRAVAGDEAGRQWREEYLRIDPTKVVAHVAATGAPVAVLGPGLPPATALALADAFDRERPDLCVVLVADPSPELVREALRAGVRDVVAPAAGRAELAQVLSRAAATAERRQARAEAAAPARATHVVTVLSPKGGTGKTAVATNLAVGLAARRPGQVALVDLDLQFGDVATALGLSPRQGLGDVAACPGPLTATMVKVFLSPHPSGLYALCAPPTPAEGDSVTGEHVAQAVGLLAGEFATVVVDTGAGLSEHALAAVELSSDLVLVSTPEVTSVRSLRKALDALDELGLAAARRHLVVNRADARGGLALADLEAVMAMACDVQVGGSPSVPDSMNLGSPVIESEPRSAVARQLARLVDAVAGDAGPGAAPETPAGGGRFRRGAR